MTHRRIIALFSNHQKLQIGPLRLEKLCLPGPEDIPTTRRCAQKANRAKYSIPPYYVGRVT